LREYRKKIDPQARLVVVSMTGTRSSITDPADPVSLDVCGFDSAVPQLIADSPAEICEYAQVSTMFSGCSISA
jgi:hypothetical protein